MKKNRIYVLLHEIDKYTSIDILMSSNDLEEVKKYVKEKYPSFKAGDGDVYVKEMIVGKFKDYEHLYIESVDYIEKEVIVC
jgi:hypothetical protein